MYNTLQPTSLVPFETDFQKSQHIHQPAIVISMIAKGERPYLGKRKNSPEEILPFSKWKMPMQEQGYIKENKHVLF